MNRKRSRPKIDQKMPTVHPNAAAIDVGATMHMAAVARLSQCAALVPSRPICVGWWTGS
jgi:hypothetical protein